MQCGKRFSALLINRCTHARSGATNNKTEMGFPMISFRSFRALHPDGCRPSWGLASALVFSFFTVSSPVVAEWTDPLHSPAIQAERSSHALILDIARAGDRLVAVGAYGNILFSDDDGLSWQQASVPVRITLTAVSFVDARHGWACGHDGVILATVDGGQSWHKQLDGFRANEAIVQAAAQQVADLEAQLDQLSTDGGDTADLEAQIEEAGFALDDARYDADSGSTRPFLDVLFLDASNGLAVGAYGMLFASRDGGQSWQENSARLPNPERFHLNLLTRTDDGALWIAGESGLLLRSRDLGEHWEALESPYEGSLFSLHSVGEQVLLSGLRGHLYIGNNHEWQEIATGSEQTLMAMAREESGSLVLTGNGGALLRISASGQLISGKRLMDNKSRAAIMPTAHGWLLAGEAGLQLLADEAGQPVDVAFAKVEGQ